LLDVERLGRGHLHAVGQLEAFDPRGQFRSAVPLVVAAIQAVQEASCRRCWRRTCRPAGQGCRSERLAR